MMRSAYGVLMPTIRLLVVASRSSTFCTPIRWLAPSTDPQGKDFQMANMIPNLPMLSAPAATMMWSAVVNLPVLLGHAS